MTSMASTAVITIVPPFIEAAMPGHSSYPIFFFFAFCLVIATFSNYYLLPR